MDQITAGKGRDFRAGSIVRIPGGEGGGNERELLVNLLVRGVKTVLTGLGTLGLFVIFTIYHWRLLRQDGVKVDATNAKRQQAFPVAIVSQSADFNQVVSQTLSALTPDIPQILQTAGQPIAEGFEEAQAMILSAEILITGDQIDHLIRGQITGCFRAYILAITQDRYSIGQLANFIQLM